MATTRFTVHTLVVERSHGRDHRLRPRPVSLVAERRRCSLQSSRTGSGLGGGNGGHWHALVSSPVGPAQGGASMTSPSPSV
jgi:hypothetical protein